MASSQNGDKAGNSRTVTRKNYIEPVIKGKELNAKLAKKREQLFSLLLEVSTYILILKRNAGFTEKKAPSENDCAVYSKQEPCTTPVDEATMQNLASILTMLNKGDTKILRVAKELQRSLKKLRHKMQQETTKYISEEYSVSRNEISATFEGSQGSAIINQKTEVKSIPEIGLKFNV